MWFIKYIIWPPCSYIIGRGIVGAIHLIGYRPDDWLADKLAAIYNGSSNDVAWIFAGLLTIAIYFLGLWGITVWRNKIYQFRHGTNENQNHKKEENYAITLELKRTLISYEEPAWSPVLNFEIMKSGMGGGNGPSNHRDSIPDENRKSPFNRWVCEMELLNKGEHAIFNIFIPIKVIYFEATKEQDGSIASGKIIKTAAHKLKMQKLEPNKPIVFWLINSTHSFIQIDFINHLLGETHTSGRSEIPFILVRDREWPISLGPVIKRA